MGRLMDTECLEIYLGKRTVERQITMAIRRERRRPPSVSTLRPELIATNLTGPSRMESASLVDSSYLCSSSFKDIRSAAVILDS